MPKKRKEYFYAPETKRYYEALKDYATTAGCLASKKGLLFELDNPSPNAKCLHTLRTYYDGDRGKLVRSIKRKDEQLKKGAWRKLLRASDTAGFPRDTIAENHFYKAMILPEKDCDLRARVHDWCNTELDRIEKAQCTVLPPLEGPNRVIIQPQSIPEIMERYEELCAQRTQRKRQH